MSSGGEFRQSLKCCDSITATNLSPDPAAQLGLAKTDAHAGAVTASGSGVK